jgi:hypothetical protein
MSEEGKIDPGHDSKRNTLRVAGVVILVIGLACTGLAFLSFIFAMFTHSIPYLFPLGFIGLPLMFVGTVMCMFGFMGKVQRYAAGEAAPVQKDVVNYMAEGTQDGVRTMACAVGEGLGIAAPDARTKCPQCGKSNDADAKFCSECGAAVGKSKACPACSEMNDVTAKFCDNCGKAIA